MIIASERERISSPVDSLHIQYLSFARFVSQFIEDIRDKITAILSPRAEMANARVNSRGERSSRRRVCRSAWAMLWHATRPLLWHRNWHDAEEGLNSEGERKADCPLCAHTCTHRARNITPPRARIQNNATILAQRAREGTTLRVQVGRIRSLRDGGGLMYPHRRDCVCAHVEGGPPRGATASAPYGHIAIARARRERGRDARAMSRAQGTIKKEGEHVESTARVALTDILRVLSTPVAPQWGPRANRGDRCLSVDWTTTRDRAPYYRRAARGPWTRIGPVTRAGHLRLARGRGYIIKRSDAPTSQSETGLAPKRSEGDTARA